MLRWKLWPTLFTALLLTCIRTAGADVALVKANTLSLRTKPNTSSTRVETLHTYEPVKVLARRGDWANVQTSASTKGWVLAQYLSKTPFVSVDIDRLNIRSGPGTDHPVQMRVARGYPLYVVGRSGSWLFVMDYDGDQGWVSSKLVSMSSYVITQLDKCNVRSGIGTEHDIAFKAERGVMLKVLKEKDGWLRVRHSDGDEGWMSGKIVFGWFGGDFPHVGFPKAQKS